MAVPKENLLSLGHLISRGQDTLTKQREVGGKNSEVMYLQQRLKVLKERERIAQQQNRQLLQQFDEAQDTLKEMLDSIAAMKMIRIEYEKYLQENGPYWQQQLKEKTRRAHEKRMKDHLRPNLKNNEVTKSRDPPFSLQDFQNTATPQEQSNYSRERWLSHSQPQPAGPPIRSPYQSFNSSQVPPSLISPSVFPHFHPFPHHNDPWAPSHHKPWSAQDTQTSLQAEHLLSQITGVAGIASAAQYLLGHLNTGDPPPERRVSSTVRKDESSSASSSKRERGGGSRRNLLSQELDIKPVRLSSGPAESSESGRDSSLAHSKKRGGKTRRSSDRHGSQVGSTASCSPVIAPVTAGQSSASDAPSHKSHSSSKSSTRMMSRGLDPGHKKHGKGELEGTRAVEEDSESPSEEGQQVEVDVADIREKTANDKVGNKYPDYKSQSCEEESGSQEEEKEEDEEGSGSDSLKIENGTTDEVEKQENSSSEESSSKEEEENIKNNQRAGEVDGGQEDSQEETEDVKLEGEDDEEEARDEDEKDAQGDDDRVNRKSGSISSWNEVADEDVDAGSEEDEQESEEESEEEEEEEEHRSDAEELEDRDSEDSIISPQENRQKQTHVIPEEAVEDEDEEEEESKKESSDGDSNGFSDIETLLAPQEQRNEETNIQKSDEEPAEICDKVQVFHVKQYTKSDHQSDSDEFDHFYD